MSGARPSQTPAPRETSRAPAPFDVAAIRAQFPILHQSVHGKPLVYLDNAATKQKPQRVIDALSDYYRRDNANVHRGVHELSRRATDAYEGARETIRKTLNARDSAEIVFTSGTTDGINLVAQTLGRTLAAGDEIVITHMEHHSNIVPWQLLEKERGVVVKVAPIDDDGALDIAEFERLLSPRTRLVSVVHESNSLGTINPIARIIERAHAVGAKVLVDAAQSIAHTRIDVQALDVDFLVFSSHKVYGPTGVGVLYGKRALLEALPPWKGGGDMILSVTFAKTTFNALPYKFEAGTPNIADAIGLGAALEWLASVGAERAAAHEHALLDHGTALLRAIPGIRLIGTASAKASVLSFVIDGIHPHDAGTVLDNEGVAVRTGHHCTQPVMDRFDVPATIRASLAVYNTREDLDRLAAAVKTTIEVLG